MKGTARSGRRLALGASVALLVAGLVGVPAYVSGVGSAALAIQIDDSCLTDLGVRLPAPDAATLARLDQELAEVRSVGRPVVSDEAELGWVSAAGPDDSPRRMVLFSRPGQFDQLGVAVAAPGPGEVFVPEWATSGGSLLPGTVITAQPFFRGRIPDGVDRTPVELRVVGTYPTIPTRPESPYWCGSRDLLRFSAFGDPPPPLMLTDPGTFARLSPTVWTPTWEVSPDPTGLRRDQAAATITGLERLIDTEFAAQQLDPTRKPVVALGTSLRRADQVADFVRLTIEPLRYASVFVALALVVGSSTMVARQERRELRLRALRGVGAFGIARSQLRWIVPTTLVGAVVGGLLGFVAARQLGPDPHIEPSALRLGALSALLGWLLATVVAAAVIGAIATAMVDRRRRAGFDGRLIAEVVVVALAVWAFVRLDRYGGVRQIGVEVRGGDLLAQAFPLLGALAAVVLVVRPARWVLVHLRSFGRSLPVALQLGIRRISAEPVATTALLAATALSVAVAFQASALTTSVDRLLDDKAGILVGADLEVFVLEPATDLTGLGAAATEQVRVASDDRAYRLLGVDPATFAMVARWRDDAADVTLATLMDRLAADPARAAIVVDPAHGVPEGPLTVPVRRSELALDVVGTASFFPGYSTGTPLLVVDRSLLDNRGERSILISQPEPTAVSTLLERGSRVVDTRTPDEVFDGTNFLSARWSYATLTAFAVLLGAVTLVAQILVLESRLRSRQVARVLNRPMGLRRRDEVIASGIEVGVPLIGGAVFGVATGWVVAGVALARLDSLRTVQPPAQLHVDGAAALVATAVIIVVTVVLAVVGAVRIERVNPSEVMRVADT